MIKYILMRGCSTESCNNKHDTGCCRVLAGLAVPPTTAPLHRDFKRGRHYSSLSDVFWPARQKTLPHSRLWHGHMCPIRKRQLPTIRDRSLYMGSWGHINCWLPPKGVLQVWCVPTIPVFNRNISLQPRNLSLCLAPSCFPWGTQSSTGASPSSARKAKASQANPAGSRTASWASPRSCLAAAVL